MDASGEFVYDFYGSSGAALANQVQHTVDECRAQGADYVIALAHLGDDESSAPFRSTDLIAATSGIDVVLDGHSHSVISCQWLENKQGELVALSSTGTGLANIGQLIITPGGNISVGLVSSFPWAAQEVADYIAGIQSQYAVSYTHLCGKPRTNCCCSTKIMKMPESRASSPATQK